MATIRVKSDDLRNTAAGFRDDVTAIKSTTQSMFELIDGLVGTAWSGEAANAYKTKFDSLEIAVQNLATLVENTAQALDDIGTEYDNAETENQGIAQNLKADVLQ